MMRSAGAWATHFERLGIPAGVRPNLLGLCVWGLGIRVHRVLQEPLPYTEESQMRAALSGSFSSGIYMPTIANFDTTGTTSPKSQVIT